MNKALMIIDVQKGFINKATRHIPKKVESLQAKYEHVFIIKFYNKDTSFYRSLIDWYRFDQGSDDTELAFNKIDGAHIIEKNGYSCVDDSFIQTLQSYGIKKIDLCGLETEVCVTKCAADLFERGIIPVVLEDYCASCDGIDAHMNGLIVLKKIIGVRQIVSDLPIKNILAEYPFKVIKNEKS